MTPKEKAIELFERMYKVDSIDDEIPMLKLYAFKCTLIAVDEILKLEFIDSVFVSFSDLSLQEYWKEVKKEIEKL